MVPDPTRRYPLFDTDRNKLYLNFGFWDSVPNPEKKPDGYFNRLIEKEIAPIGGIKSLYSDSYYSKEEFWKIYGNGAYDALKKKYDPEGKLKDLYQKCVQKK